MPAAQPDGLQAKPENEQDLRPLKLPHVFQAARKPRIDVIAFNIQRRWRIWLPVARIPAEALKHELHHVALAVVRRRRVGEDEQFYWRHVICDLRAVRILES